MRVTGLIRVLAGRPSQVPAGGGGAGPRCVGARDGRQRETMGDHDTETTGEQAET